MVKILISDKMSAKAEEIFKQNSLEVDVKTNLSPEELKEIIKDYDGLAIRSSTTVTREILANAKKLKVIARAGIGVDNIDQEAASDYGVIVMNTPFGNSVTTAEHAIAMMFAAARQIPQASSSTHAGKWEKSKFMGTEITGKTLGLIGCGNIGSIVIKKAQGLGMKVVGYDPYLTDEKANLLNIEKSELNDLLKKADFISLHVPLTEQTKNIINKDSFSVMKNSAILINCARGGLVDEEALKEALDDNQIRAAALDVFAKEPAKENILFGHEKLICTPHLGASTNEAQENVAIQVAEQISNYLKHNIIENSLNIPAISPEDAKILDPYLKLGEYLGNLAGQIAGSAIKSIKISYQGKITKLNTKPVTAITLKNILSSITAGVNIVNSKKIAKDRGIALQDITSNKNSDYATYLNINIETEQENISVAGTLFQNEPRITEVNQIKLEANISKNMIFIENHDKPGLIGEIGTLLGKNSHNIANFHLGRNENNNGSAIALIALDDEPSSQALDEIAKLESVIKLQKLKF